MPKRLRLSGDRESEVSSPETLDKDDNIAVSEEDEPELESDQPMDFSKQKLDSSGGAGSGGQFSILGSYLKSGKEEGRFPPGPGFGSELAGSWLEPLASLARSAPRPCSRDSRGDSRDERENSGEEGEVSHSTLW